MDEGDSEADGRWLKVAVVAERFGVTSQAIRTMIHDGRCPPASVRQWRNRYFIDPLWVVAELEAKPQRRRQVAQQQSLSKPAADQPNKPRRYQVDADAASLRRFPPGDMDRAVTRAVNQLRTARLPDTSKDSLAVKAGKSRSHAGRCLADSGPRQAWTLADMNAYAGALGVSLAELLTAAEVISTPTDVTAIVLADPKLGDRWARVITDLLRLAREGHDLQAEGSWSPSASGKPRWSTS